MPGVKIVEPRCPDIGKKMIGGEVVSAEKWGWRMCDDKLPTRYAETKVQRESAAAERLNGSVAGRDEPWK